MIIQMTTPETNSAGLLVQMLLEYQNNVKIYHFTTTSYARHVAAGKLHDNLVEKIDKFMEVYQGKYSRVNFSQQKSHINLYQIVDSQMVEYLQNVCKSLGNDALIVNKYVSIDDTDLLAIRDDILADINQTIYLFGTK